VTQALALAAVWLVVLDGGPSEKHRARIRMDIFEPYSLGNLQLQNRVVMAPMTRSRAIGNVPNDLMAEYYKQRASAGLIITEGTAPSPNGLGYARIPGSFSDAQVAGWRKVTAAAHSGGAKIFLQLMHTGRITHALNLPKGAEVVAPSAVAAAGQMWTDQSGMQSFPTPRALETREIPAVIAEYTAAATNGIKAGFDGIELHGANGYLIEQFLNPGTNKRTDSYGGSIENRNRFAVEVSAAIAKAIGADKTAIRLSPFNTFNDMVGDYPEIPRQFEALAKGLGALKLAYIHVVSYSKVGEPLLRAIKKAFGRTIIINGGLDKQKAEAAFDSGLADLAAFATGFLSNPDLPYRLKNDLALNPFDQSTFYSAEAKGYTDYPVVSTPGA
jgi:N-ethylmaleimide reductase